MKKIRPEDILSAEEYREKYRHHLFCCEEGCEAQIELAHRNGQPYFRTWRNSKHAENCRFAFENDPTKVSEQPAGTGLSVSVICNIALDLVCYGIRLTQLLSVW